MTNDPLWHPDATLVLPADGHNGLSFAGFKPRGVLHITVSRSYSPSTASYYGNPYWPHATITDSRIYQHLPINVGGYALAHEYGPETNRANAIQCEVVWPDAADANMPDALLRNLASWMRFVSEYHGIPYTFSEMYRPGVTLASVNSPIRFSDAEWTNFTGWCAHSNVPGGNDHWDANFDVARLQALLGAAPTPAPTPAPAPPETYVPDTTVLTFAHSGLVLDVSGQSTENGAPVIQWPLTGAKNQLVRFVPFGDGYDYIVFEHSGKVLDHDPNTGVVHQIVKMAGNPNQAWKQAVVNGALVALVCKSDGTVLDMPGLDTAKGARVATWTWNGGPNQLVMKTAL